MQGVRRERVKAGEGSRSLPGSGRGLAGLHRALLTYYPQTFITALYLLLDPVPEGHRLTMATGGHPLPLCRRGDGGIETLRRPGSFLGMEEAPALASPRPS
jgi:Stage II sporulation protein E (SpoIIE)